MNPVREGIEILRGHHFKGGYGDGHGNVCGFGALNKVVTGDAFQDMEDENSETLYNLMNQVAGEQFPERRCEGGIYHFVHFNDHDDTTEEDVIMVMDKVAVAYDEVVK